MLRSRFSEVRLRSTRRGSLNSSWPLSEPFTGRWTPIPRVVHDCVGISHSLRLRCFCHRGRCPYTPIPPALPETPTWLVVLYQNACILRVSVKNVLPSYRLRFPVLNGFFWRSRTNGSSTLDSLEFTHPGSTNGALLLGPSSGNVVSSKLQRRAARFSRIPERLYRPPGP